MSAINETPKAGYTASTDSICMTFHTTVITVPAIIELIAPAVSFRGSLGISVQGRASFVEYVRFVRRAFPDFHNTIEELIAQGDKVVARLTYSGTHQGELFGISATGRRVTYAGMATFRIVDGQIEEGWVLGDTRGLIEQLQGPPAKEQG